MSGNGGAGRITLPEIDSTNAEGFRRAPALACPTWILAGVQTAGRGRRARPWSSPQGNFHGTLVLKPTEPPETVALRSFAAALALRDAFVQLTGLPQGTFASKVEVQGETVTVTREIDGGLEKLSMPMPAVITVDLRLNEPRYVTLPNIMKAKKKPIDSSTPADHGVDTALRLKLLKVQDPPARKAGIKVPDVATLVDKLRNEAKVV